MATHQAFTAMPDEVWAWYLYRRSVCLAAEPNPAHLAVARLQKAYGDRAILITQNVDGLHLRAGSPPERTYEIHGDVQYMRCSAECTAHVLPIPATVDHDWPKGRALGEEERQALECPRCGARTRPHVLWFDETYDEEHFRFESSMRAAAAAELLVVVGTTGQTNLPLQVSMLVARRGAPMIAVNPEPTVVTELAEQSKRGAFLEGTAGRWVPDIVEELERLV
jgi:NAD-dependent deacetylase